MGYVYDDTDCNGVFDGGVFLEGATVLASSSIGIFTDINGQYKLNLPPGDYNVVASFPGYEVIQPISGSFPITIRVIVYISHY